MSTLASRGPRLPEALRVLGLGLATLLALYPLVSAGAGWDGGPVAFARHPVLALAGAVAVAAVSVRLAGRGTAALAGVGWLLLSDVLWTTTVTARAGAALRVVVGHPANAGDPCLAACPLAPLATGPAVAALLLVSGAFWVPGGWRSGAASLLLIEGLHLWAGAKGAVYQAGAWTTAPAWLHGLGSLLVGLALAPVDAPAAGAVAALLLLLAPRYGLRGGAPVAYPVAPLDPAVGAPLLAAATGLAAVVTWRIHHLAKLDADA